MTELAWSSMGDPWQVGRWSLTAFRQSTDRVTIIRMMKDTSEHACKLGLAHMLAYTCRNFRSREGGMLLSMLRNRKIWALRMT